MMTTEKSWTLCRRRWKRDWPEAQMIRLPSRCFPHMCVLYQMEQVVKLRTVVSFVNVDKCGCLFLHSQIREGGRRKPVFANFFQRSHQYFLSFFILAFLPSCLRAVAAGKFISTFICQLL